MKKFNVLSESRKIRTKLLAMLVIGCSVISQLTSIPAYAGTQEDGYIVNGIIAEERNPGNILLQGVNIALGKTATASSSCYNEYPSNAVNGTCSNGSDKWCTGNIGGEKWLQLDLGENFNINRWVVYHADVVESNHLNYNTRDFRLQQSDDCITWYDVDVVKQNSESITARRVQAFNTRYVRLYIDCGQQNDNNCARIFEFRLFYDEKTNLALNKPASASKEYGAETADKAVNGTLYDAVNKENIWCYAFADKWCTGEDIGGEKWLKLDLGDNFNINKWVVYHAELYEDLWVGSGKKYPQYNTRDFRLQKSDDGITWYDVDTVVQNSSALTERNVAPFNARYVRLYIDCAQQNDNNVARIYEFQLFYNAEVNLALNRPVSASKEYSSETAAKAVNGSYGIYDSYNRNDKWCTGGFDANCEKWLTVDLGKVTSVNRWKVFHAGVLETTDYNTKVFGLQASLNGVDWETIDYVYDNTSSITDRVIAPCSGRYFRLWIDQATQYDNSCARIYEFQLF